MMTVFESVKIVLHFELLIQSEFHGETSNNYCILCSKPLFMKKASSILFEIKEANKPFLTQE